jgi:hypothetical protein
MMLSRVEARKGERTMSLSTTPAYIGTVGEGHTVSVPSEVPIGSKVAILLLPPEASDEKESARKERFESVLAAIRSAIAAGYTTPTISDEELEARIRRARQQKSS